MMSDNNGNLDSHDHDELILINSVIKENENPNFGLLDDLDSTYLQVSRFVSDSVTREMLNAVETEARMIVSSEENETSSSRLILDQACNDKERLWVQNVESCSKKSLVLDDQKTKEIAGLRCELELISKLLTGYANGDIDEALESKKNADQLNRKVFGSVGSTSSSIWVENGLRHLSHEELINYLKNEMNQMKREHDYTIQEMTEEYFSIKRRCLTLENRGLFSCLKKDKEFDVLRKKIPDFISKLDKVLLEDEKSADTEFKSQRVDSLLLENRQLKERLIDLEDSCAKERVGYKMEISELKQKLELARENMKIAENEKVKFEMKLVSTEAEQKRLKHQFVSTVLSLANWSQGFDSLECVLAEKMKTTNARLESMQSQISDLLDEVDELKVRESMYKKHMEKKTCDLHKAETEVDLLGDEIESLLDLLSKIYIALDHYSLILKHYPGIIEILKLVRRELRGESKRLSVFRPSLI